MSSSCRPSAKTPERWVTSWNHARACGSGTSSKAARRVLEAAAHRAGGSVGPPFPGLVGREVHVARDGAEEVEGEGHRRQQIRPKPILGEHLERLPIGEAGAHGPARTGDDERRTPRARAKPISRRLTIGVAPAPPPWGRAPVGKPNSTRHRAADQRARRFRAVVAGSPATQPTANRSCARRAAASENWRRLPRCVMSGSPTAIPRRRARLTCSDSGSKDRNAARCHGLAPSPRMRRELALRAFEILGEVHVHARVRIEVECTHRASSGCDP